MTESNAQEDEELWSGEFKPEKSVGYHLRETYRLFTKTLQAKIGSPDVTLGMWFFLRSLWEEDGVSQRELARRIGLMEPTAVTALAAMERRGLINRKSDPTDKRRRLVYLTEKGRGMKAEMLPHAMEANLIALQGFTSEEVVALLSMLKRMKQNLDVYRVERGWDVLDAVD